MGTYSFLFLYRYFLRVLFPVFVQIHFDVIARIVQNEVVSDTITRNFVIKLHPSKNKRMFEYFYYR